MHGTPMQRATVSTMQAAPRLSHWIVVFSIPVMLFALLALTMQDWQVARAADRTVGTCSDATYADIQSAVQDANPGDVINICPGTYNESVNLSLMQNIGDITLRKAPGQTGDVTIKPGSNAAIRISQIFTGNITIDGLILDSDDPSEDGSGIDFGSYFCCPPTLVNGNVIVKNVVATSNSAYGAYIYALGRVTVETSFFEDNGFGNIYGYEGLVIRTNSQTVGDDPSRALDVYINEVTANRNKGTGIDINVYGHGNIEILNTQANENGDPQAIGNGAGIYVYQFDYTLCFLAIEAHTPAPYLYIQNVTANNNRIGSGIQAAAENITIVDTTANGNPFDGISANANGCPGNERLELSNSTAISNGWGTSSIEYSGYAPIFGGFRLLSRDTILIRNHNIAQENEGFGYCYFTVGTALVENSLAIANSGDGFTQRDQCPSMSMGIGSIAGSTVENDSFGEDLIEAKSSEAGISVANGELPSNVISNSTAILNGETGFSLAPNFYPETKLVNITSSQNITGVAFAPSNTPLLIVSLAIDSVVPSGGATTIHDSLIQGNENVGVYYGQIVSQTINDIDIKQLAETGQGQVTAAEAYTSSNTIRSSIICENGVGLLAEQFKHTIDLIIPSISALDEDTYLLDVDARGNWWGHPTGPNATGNPGGQGNGIQTIQFDPVNDSIQVLYNPWISIIEGSASPNPTIQGVPVNVAYRFRDGGSLYFLENGVGDPNRDPIFTLSATNGTLAGSPGKYIVDSLIAESITPNGPGNMTVTLDGPCGLDAMQTILVATPGIEVEKSPDLQGVAAGDSVVFTVTVFNTGNIPLTNISVSDPLVQDCSRAEGALGDLAVSGSVSYTCIQNSVVNNFVNTITAQGYALVDNEAAGAAVTDSDTATVVIADLELTKTVFVDGFREPELYGGPNPSDCALNSVITVPVSTTVKYCYTITNTGDYTLSIHSLVDSHFPNAILSNFPRELGPGESFSTVDVGINVTRTLFLEPGLSTTNVATWTAEIAAPIVALGANAVHAAIPAVAVASATVNISTDDLDQDGDGIPDNIEGTADPDNDGIPAFLDPDGPTNVPPSQQPNQKTDIFLPSLSNND